MTEAFNVLLAVLVLGLAVRLLVADDLFEAVVLFVAFGLAMALVWVRLGAVDVALAEAALGTGVTGALLVNTLKRLRHDAPAWLERKAGRVVPPLGLLSAVAAVAGVAGAVVLTRTPPAGATSGAVVLERTAETAVSNPVTAVLLDFRAYDTLLEVAVLVAGVVAVWALERGRPAVPSPATAVQEPVLASLAGRVVPLILIAATYIGWRGATGPGGAFQAGALLAGAGVLMLAAGFTRPYSPGSPVLRIAVAAGLLVFAGVAVQTLASSGAMLRYGGASAYAWILAIEATLTISIAATLAELFVDVPAVPHPGEP